jgi:hypothetical protein
MNAQEDPHLAAAAAYCAGLAKALAAKERAKLTPIERMYEAGEIEGFHLQAVNRLMADIKLAAVRQSQDLEDTNTYEDIHGVRDEHGELVQKPLLGTEFDTVVWMRAKFGASSLDPQFIHAPFPDILAHHERAVIRATAPGRVAAAMARVEALCPGSLAMLIAAADGSSWRSIGAEHGLDHKTVKAHVADAICMLTDHLRAEDRRPVFAVWGAVDVREATPSTRFLSTPGWRLTDDGKEIVARCRHTGPSIVTTPLAPPRGPAVRPLLTLIGELEKAAADLALDAATDDQAAAVRRELLASVRRLTPQVVRGGIAPRITVHDWHGEAASLPPDQRIKVRRKGHGAIRYVPPKPPLFTEAQLADAEPLHRTEMKWWMHLTSAAPIVQHVPHALLMTVAGWMPPAGAFVPLAVGDVETILTASGRARSFLSQTIPQQPARNAILNVGAVITSASPRRFPQPEPTDPSMRGCPLCGRE